MSNKIFDDKLRIKLLCRLKQNEYDKLRKRVKNLAKEKMHKLKAKYKRLKAVYYAKDWRIIVRMDDQQ